MKKWICTLLTALFMALIVVETGAASVSAATDKTGTTSDGYSYKISAKTGDVEITGYKGKKKKLVLPDTIEGKEVKKIGERAFSKNNSIVSVKVSDSVEHIACDAFESCDKLRTIELGKSVKQFSDEPDWLYKWTDDLRISLGENFEEFKVDEENESYYAIEGVLFKKDKEECGLIYYPKGKECERYAIPDGITDVYLDSFEDTQIAVLVIPQSVTCISTKNEYGSVPFGKLEEYVVDEANERYLSADGVLFEKNYTTPDGLTGSYLEQYPAEKKDISYTVPEGVARINEGSFCGHKYLESVTIPGTVKYIGWKAFNGMENLQSADIGAEIISDEAFSFCQKLANITLQNTVNSICEDAFDNVAVESLVLPESVEYIDGLWSPALKKLEVRNKSCELEGIGCYINQLVVYGYDGSTAEEWAKQAGCRFKLIGEEETPDERLNESTINRDTVQLSKTSYIYNGKAQKPKVVVKDKFGKTINKEYYKVTYKNNKNVGLATVKIQLKGSYTGTIKTTFSIKPPLSTITKAEKTEKGFRVQWKGVKASQIDGYEIQYSTDKKFRKENINRVFVNQSNAVKKNIKAAKTENKYYVRIRSYKVVSKDGKTERLYSKWSEKKTVKNS